MCSRLGTSLQCFETANYQRLWEASFPGGMCFGLHLSADDKRLALANSAGCWITPAGLDKAQMRQIARTPESPGER